jgi:hypothetical protein
MPNNPGGYLIEDQWSQFKRDHNINFSVRQFLGIGR